MNLSLGYATNGVKAFSLSLSAGFDAAHHREFRTVEDSFPMAVIKATERAWSPIVWKGGVRKKPNFESCGIVALDVDDGFSVDNAAQWLHGLGYTSAILLSKSHQKQKGQMPPCDRFRILIDAGVVRDLEQYEANMRFWMSLLPMADKACKDGARFFFPSPSIAYQQAGKPYEWQDFSALIAKEKLAMKRRTEAQIAKVKSSGAISEGLRAFIMRGVPEGERHNVCYWLGCVLGNLGLSLDESIKLISAGPLGDLGMAEITRTVRDARKVARNG